jgi:NADH-quinone oxidoreductase subunit H
MDFLIDIGINIVLTLIVFVGLLLIVAYSTWFERKLLGDFQLRYGPMRVGFHGLMQPIADAIKSFFKEDVIPEKADKIVFILAPMISFATAVAVIAVIPFGGTVHIFGREVKLILSDIDISVLYVFALAAIGSYGCVLGGYASYNKYSLVGALRASALMISYELPFALTIIAVVLVSGTLSFSGIVDAQTGLWNIVKQPVAFVLAIICSLAEINRTPFDMPETESELACGFNVEYSSMKFSMFFMAEYCHLFTISAIITTLFLGGWHGPFLPGPVWFLLKSVALMYFFVWERATYPRLRIDQILRLGWKVLMPIALANLVVTAIVLSFLN